MSGTAAIWLAAFVASTAAIAIARAATRTPPETLDFDKPLNRAIAAALAWANLAVAAAIAVVLDGLLIPPLALAAISAAIWLAARRFDLAGRHKAVAPLAALALVCNLALFQIATANLQF